MLIAAAVFVFFVVGGSYVSRRQNTPEKDKRSVSLFLIFVCMASLAPGLTQRDLWPFSAWPLVAGELLPTVTQPRLMVVDGSGRELELDYRAVQPFEFDELMSWLDGRMGQLDDLQRRQAFAYILRLIRNGQARVASRGTPGYFSRVLGPLTAPYFVLHPKKWTDGDYPRERIAGVRFYHERWTLGDRDRTLSKTLVYEYMGATGD